MLLRSFHSNVRTLGARPTTSNEKSHITNLKAFGMFLRVKRLRKFLREKEDSRKFKPRRNDFQ